MKAVPWSWVVWSAASQKQLNFFLIPSMRIMDAETGAEKGRENLAQHTGWREIMIPIPSAKNE